MGRKNHRMLLFAPPIAVAGQTLGIALACENGVDNLHPCLPVNIADDLSQFEVHLLQGFLHMLDSARGHGNQHTALPQIAPQDTDLVLGTKGATQ